MAFIVFIDPNILVDHRVSDSPWSRRSDVDNLPVGGIDLTTLVHFCLVQHPRETQPICTIFFVPFAFVYTSIFDSGVKCYFETILVGLGSKS